MRPTLLRTIALAGVLVLVACTPSTSSPTAAGNPTAASTAAGTASSGPAATTASDATPIQVRDFALDPGTVSVTGTTVALAVTNDGPTVHNVTVRDESGTVLFGSRDLREGESETVTSDVAPGSYVLFCSLAGHESLGIKGTLTVSAP